MGLRRKNSNIGFTEKSHFLRGEGGGEGVGQGVGQGGEGAGIKTNILGMNFPKKEGGLDSLQN